MRKGILILTVLVGLGIFVWKKASESSSVDSKQSTSSPTQGASPSATSHEASSHSVNSILTASSQTHSPATAPASNLPTGTGSPNTTEMGGTPANASVKVGQKDFNLTPNDMGMFPRVLVPANGKIQISVAYPEGTPEDPLVIQAEDGGLLDNGSVVKPAKLDQDKVVSFEFQTNEQEGVYRVTLRKGTDEKRLDFWVGEEPKLQKGS